MKDFVINYYLQAKLSVCRAEVIFSVSSLVTRSSSFADHRETSKLFKSIVCPGIKVSTLVIMCQQLNITLFACSRFCLLLKWEGRLY